MPNTRRLHGWLETRTTLELGLKSASSLLILFGLTSVVVHYGCASSRLKSSPPAPLGLASGQNYFHSGQYSLARTQWRRAVYEAQDSLTRHVLFRGIAETYWREGDSTNTNLELQKAMKETAPPQEQSRTLLLRSLALESLGKPEEASAMRLRIAPAELARLGAWERELRAVTAPTAPKPGAEENSDYGITILPRNLWGPDPIRSNYDLIGNVTRVTVHHTGDAFTALDRGSVKSEIRRIQKVHQGNDGRHGWADIGYHYLLDRNGVIWEGRPEWMQGAHAGNTKANRGNLGICVLGNYENQMLTPAQESTLRRFLEWICLKHAIPATKIYTHREMHQLYADLKGTDCPGVSLQSTVERIRRSLMAHRTTTPSASQTPTLLRAGMIRSDGR